MSIDYTSLFGIEDGVHYLNCAYMSPFLRRQQEAGHAAVDRLLDPSTLYADDFFSPVEETKALIAELVGIPSPKQIAIVPSVSYGVSTLAANIDLSPGSHVVVTAEQFPSNVYPWLAAAKRADAQVIFVERPKNETSSWSEKIAQSITPNTAVVAMAQIHWTDGHMFDLEMIGAAARHHDALLIIDGTQSVGAMPFDFERIKPDALLCAAYKWLLGPYSIGFAYFSERFDTFEPLEYSWMTRLEAENFKELVNYQPLYQPGSAKFSMGELSNFLAIPIWQEGLKQLIAWSPELIQQHVGDTAGPWRSKWAESGFHVTDDCARHLFGIGLGRAVCATYAPGLFRKARVFISLRDENIRVAPHLFNTDADYAALTECLMELGKIQSQVFENVQ